MVWLESVKNVKIPRQNLPLYGNLLYMGIFWWGKFGKFGGIASYSPKISSPIFIDTLKMYLAYALTLTYSPNFSSPIAFTDMVRQKFPVYGSRQTTFYITTTCTAQIYKNYWLQYKYKRQGTYLLLHSQTDTYTNCTIIR